MVSGRWGVVEDGAAAAVMAVVVVVAGLLVEAVRKGRGVEPRGWARTVTARHAMPWAFVCLAALGAH